MPRIRRILDLPRAHRPCWWSQDRRSDLWYLGWGLRNFRKNPTVATVRDSSHFRGGWSYTLVLKGSPTILLADGSLRLKPNDAIISAPPRDYTTGFRDEADEYCENLIWIWRNPPLVTELRARPGGYQLCHVNEETRRRLQNAHADCRWETENPDKFTARFLRGVRYQIETALARCAQAQPVGASREKLARAAARWMEQQFHQANPILLLCDYLQVSRSTLDRLFAEHFGKSPSDYLLELRMRKAKEWKREGKRSAKDIAFALGYKHATNFSRAFKAYERQTGRQR
jgi:AraC-like DNA-binding protein